MKRALITILCLMFAAAAFAGPENASDKVASEMMFRIDHGGTKALLEGFEAGVPPAGWTLVQTNVNETWQAECTGTYGTPVDGSCFAVCFYDADYSGPQDEWLKFDYTLEPGDECLSFYANASVYWAVTPYQNYNVIVTIDGAEVWNYYDDNNAAVNFEWQQYSIDLSGYSVGQTITVGFGYVGYDGAQASLDAIAIGECPPPPPEPCCPSEYVCYVVDFNNGDGAAVPVDCGLGPNPWEWGVPANIPTVACDDVPVTNVWGTILAADYPLSAGGGLMIGPFDISPQCDCMELCHYYYSESGFDGGNVKVSTDGGTTWQIITPFGGYDDILDSEAYIAECVAGEETFTGDSTTFVRDCFDLSAYDGQTVMVGFFFGSDSSVAYYGWYLKWVKIGSDEYSPVQDSSWGAIKAMYR